MDYCWCQSQFVLALCDMINIFLSEHDQYISQISRILLIDGSLLIYEKVSI
jgi:hypothetical protein